MERGISRASRPLLTEVVPRTLFFQKFIFFIYILNTREGSLYRDQLLRKQVKKIWCTIIFPDLLSDNMKGFIQFLKKLKKNKERRGGPRGDHVGCQTPALLGSGWTTTFLSCLAWFKGFMFIHLTFLSHLMACGVDVPGGWKGCAGTPRGYWGGWALRSPSFSWSRENSTPSSLDKQGIDGPKSIQIKSKETKFTLFFWLRRESCNFGINAAMRSVLH